MAILFFISQTPPTKTKIIKAVNCQSSWGVWKLWMSFDFVYLSCLSVFGGVAFPCRILKWQWEETFGNLANQLAVSRLNFMKTEISVSDLFIHPFHIVDMETPIHVCHQFGCLMYVLVYSKRLWYTALCLGNEYVIRRQRFLSPICLYILLTLSTWRRPFMFAISLAA